MRNFLNQHEHDLSMVHSCSVSEMICKSHLPILIFGLICLLLFFLRHIWTESLEFVYDSNQSNHPPISVDPQAFGELCDD